MGRVMLVLCLGMTLLIAGCASSYTAGIRIANCTSSVAVVDIHFDGRWPAPTADAEFIAGPMNWTSGLVELETGAYDVTISSSNSSFTQYLQLDDDAFGNGLRVYITDAGVHQYPGTSSACKPLARTAPTGWP